MVRPLPVALLPLQVSMLWHIPARRLAGAPLAEQTDRHARGRGARGRLEKSLK